MSRSALASAACAAVAAWLLAAPQAAHAVTWCGAPAAADRLPDVLPGAQFHLVYATPADGADAFADWVGRIVDDQEAIEAWWLTQDPARTPRHDLYAFGCDSYWGQLDVSSVRLPQLGLFYADAAVVGDRLTEDLRRLGFDHPRKKYVVYYDGPVAYGDAGGFCGQSRGISFGWGISILYVQTDRCPLADDRFRRHVVAHEMLHSMEVPSDSIRVPHVCRDDRDHFCDSELDIMTGLPTRRIGLDDGVVLDYGRDDYYGHNGTWWDAQDSPFLEPTHAATVSVSVAGAAGVVHSSDGTIACPSTCSGRIELGRRVTLTAAPAVGARFAGWGGRCAGLAEGCVIHVDADLDVTAAFAPVRRTLRIVVGRGGRVVLSTRRSCTSTCRVSAAHGATIVLTARPRAGYRFHGWSGACRGARVACAIAVARDRAVTASFRRAG